MGHRLLLGIALSDLRRFLSNGTGEQVVFLFACVSGAQHLTFKTNDLYVCGPNDYDQSTRVHVELTDEAQARVIKMAWDRRAALIEAHSHPDSRWLACFSATDAIGLSQFAPHVRWRLKGAPYMALVFSPGSFDALVWVGRDRVEPLEQMNDGLDTFTPTGLTLRDRRLSALVEGREDA